MKPLAIIVAVARAGAIGRAGKLPWHLPEDLKHFKALTMGHAIIMGRNTHASIGRALPGRRNIVVSRKGGPFPGCEAAPSLREALELTSLDPLPFVIGGSALYAEALPRATTIYLTELARDVPDADTFFPSLSPREWREVSRAQGETPGTQYVVFKRKKADD